MMQWYKLDSERNPVPCDVVEASQWRVDNSVAVDRTAIKCYQICTSFVSLDHSFDGKELHVFETIIFSSEDDSEFSDGTITGRCGTWDEAVVMHFQCCEMVENHGKEKPTRPKIQVVK